MEITLQEIVFYVVAAAIAVFSVLAVTTGKILRAATYLLFVLFGTGAIYGVLGYTFLGAVQLMVYAGGIVVLYVFSILLTQSDKNMKYPINRGKLISVLLTTLIGAALVLFLIFTNGFALNIIPQGVELPAREIGLALIGTEKYQFVLPFEVVSILLLACMIGAILIARKSKIKITTMELDVHVIHYLVISTIMMFCGIYGFFTRKNLLALLISVELMLNATNINFAVFNRYLFPDHLEGHFFSLFGIAIAAAETAVAIAIIINVYRNIKQVLTDDITDMKG